MNTANLQLEGLIMALAAITQTLVSKEVLTADEVGRALATAEQQLLGDERAIEGLTPSNRDAVVFPLRVLQLANAMAADEPRPGFAALAKRVGETKGRYNDQQ